MKERPVFDETDHYEQITGLALTEKQLQELGERQQKIMQDQRDDEILKRWRIKQQNMPKMFKSEDLF